MVGSILKKALELRNTNAAAWQKLFPRKDPAKAQDRELKKLLTKAADTAFGEKYDFKRLLKCPRLREEFARTKQGVKDSFNAPATLNRLDWARAWAAPWQDLADYYRGLFALRVKRESS